MTTPRVPSAEELAKMLSGSEGYTDDVRAYGEAVLEVAAEKVADLWKRDDNSLSPAVLMIVAHEIRALKEDL